MDAVLHALRTSMDNCSGLFAQLGADRDASQPLTRSREQLELLELEQTDGPTSH
jgi:hypothetical protein